MFFTGDQPVSSVGRSSDDQKSDSRKDSSASSGKAAAPPPPTSAPGTRVCILQPSASRTAGFALSGKSPPPFVICQIEKDSPADKAGLLLNDVLLSINGKSVVDKSYDETVKLIKEALQQKSVELVVREQSATQLQDKDRTKTGSQSSASDPTKLSMGSYDSNISRSNDTGPEPSRQGSNAVEEYQSM